MKSPLRSAEFIPHHIAPPRATECFYDIKRSGNLADPLTARHAGRQGQIPCHRMKIRIAQFDADGLAGISFPIEVFGKAQAKASEDRREFRPVQFGVQIAFKGRFTADRLGFRFCHQFPLIEAVRRRVQPSAVGRAKILHDHCAG